MEISATEGIVGRKKTVIQNVLNKYEYLACMKIDGGSNIWLASNWGYNFFFFKICLLGNKFTI